MVSGTIVAPWGLFAAASVASPTSPAVAPAQSLPADTLRTLPQLDRVSHQPVVTLRLAALEPLAIAAPETFAPASAQPSAAKTSAAKTSAAKTSTAKISAAKLVAAKLTTPVAAPPAPEFSAQPIELKAFARRDRGTAEQLTRPSTGELLAQATTAATVAANPADAESLRQRLLIKPLVELRAPGFAPASTAGGPTAFGANWGDAFVGLSLANRRSRMDEADGAMSLGFGLGDSQKAVGFEVGVNIGSLRKFANNGDVVLKLHKSLPGKAAIALGWDSGITWGPENRNTKDTVYGVVSKVFDLKPNDTKNTLPLTVSLGLGNGRFRSVDAINNDRASVNVFASLGLQVAPQVSLVSTWNGQDLNLGVATVPWRDKPLFVSAIVANVFGNNDNATLFGISIGYGFNFLGQH